MKSLFTQILAAGLIATSAITAQAQQPAATQDYSQKMGAQYEVPFGAFDQFQQTATKKLGKLEVSEWYSYVNALTENGERYTYFSGNSIWPDSSAVQIFRDDNDNPYTSHVGTHAVGQVFDPKSEHYALIPETPQLSRFNDYTVDSIAFFYKYNNPNPGVVDTVVIDFYNGSNVVALTYTNSVTQQQWRSASFRYRQSTNKGYSPTNTIKIPISESTPDFYNNAISSFSSNLMTAATGFSKTNGGSLVGFTVSFVPGMTTQFGDTISLDSVVQGDTKLSSFMPLVIRQGTVTSPAFLEDTTMSHGVFAYSFVKYSTRATEYFYPGNLVTDAARTHIYSLFKLASDNVGVEDINASGYGLGNAYPNPVGSNQDVNIPFTIASNESVTIEMFDLVGKSVGSYTNEFVAGEHTATMSTNNLNQGVYLYTITAGDFTATKKFTVK